MPDQNSRMLGSDIDSDSLIAVNPPHLSKSLSNDTEDNFDKNFSAKSMTSKKTSNEDWFERLFPKVPTGKVKIDETLDAQTCSLAQ